MKDTGLTEKEWEQIRAVLRAVPAIEKAVLFGSRAMGLARGNSDVDIMLYGEKLTMGDVAHARALLEETTLPYQFDLVLCDMENAALQEHVRRYGKVVVNKSLSSPIDGWLQCSLGDFVALQRGYDLPDRERKNGTVPILGSFGITGYHDTAKMQGPGVTLGRSGASFGVTSYIDHNYWPLNTALYVTDFKGNNPYFTYCLFQSIDFSGFNSGSAQPSLNRNNIYQLSLVVPGPNEQDAIGHIFKVLDDRIQLLRETNATLEAMAQALFKSWFVDFDPVHAKSEGRAPEGMDAKTAALFPAEFEESELGMIPKGWKVTSLSEAYEINPRRKLKKDSFAKYLDMSSVGVQGHSVANVTIRSVGSGSKFQNGDTLFARITPCLENGKTAFVDFLDDGEAGWGSTEFIVLRPKAPLPEYHGYLLARHPVFRSFAIQSMSGTSGRQRIQTDALASFQIVIPPFLVCKAFEKIVALIQKKITASHEQARTLTALRDTLLPRLLSGKLRLPEFDGPENGASA